ncbi:sce7725 family protein [Actinomyces sp.]
MYFPYFRGKQFELILLREQADFLAKHLQVPIIAPVRSNTKQLEKSIKALNEKSAKHVVIINPSAGEHANDHSAISALLQSLPRESSTITGIKLTYDITEKQIQHLLEDRPTDSFALLHAGFQNHTWLSAELTSKHLTPSFNIFLTNAGHQYRNAFARDSVVIQDGFQLMRNRDYPPEEFFSELHTTYHRDGFDHFGDYLTIGEQYIEGGGPAYAVAIHLTYLNADDDNTIWIKHYISDSNFDTSDPANKAKEALDKLFVEQQSSSFPIPTTPALLELLNYQARNHYPGLGMLKKLSMWHHLHVVASANSVNQQGSSPFEV